MLRDGKLYLFMTLGYYYSGKVFRQTPTHVIITDARIHYEDVGDLDVFERSQGKWKNLPRGYIVPMSGTGVFPLEDDAAVDPEGLAAARQNEKKTKK